jgi:hypothetical protein
MTEKEWLTCNHLERLLEHLAHRRRQAWLNRKLRLFGSACCRRVWHLFPDERYRRAVEIAERFAAGLATERELAQAREAVEQVNPCDYAPPPAIGSRRAAPETIRQYGLQQAAEHVVQAQLKWNVAFAAFDAALVAEAVVNALTCTEAIRVAAPFDWNDRLYGGWPNRLALRWRKTAKPERTQQVALLRDVVGNPFRKARVPATRLAWISSTVFSLAAAIYEQRVFDRMPILGDALEEAGCDHADILDHCRQAGEHVLGCWVVDLVLGKK